MTALQSLLAMAVLGVVSLGPGDHTQAIKVCDLDRTYLVHIPPKYDST